VRAIWSATVRSATRVDRDTGQPVEYRLVGYDTGEATCTCPAFAFQGLRNPRLADDQKLRFRCKHLEAAIKRGVFTPADPVDAPPPAAAAPPTGPPPDVPDDPYDDDEEYVEPQVRR
jgi:hypothetical protein